VAEGASISGDGGAVDNFRQQMANNTEIAYKKGMAEAIPLNKLRSTAGTVKDTVSAKLKKSMDDYVPPREANYDDKYQAMVLRVGEKARAQEKAKQQQQSPKAPVRESRLALLKQIIQS
jgi:hypothetical protein